MAASVSVGIALRGVPALSPNWRFASELTRALHGQVSSYSRTEALVERLEPRLALSGQSITPSDVTGLLNRAAAASSATNAIIAVVDRSGNILGVRVEKNVPISTADTTTLDFAIDGAVSLARTGAFFANSRSPLTSRTVRFISQSTITQREVESSPDSTDPTQEGPGYVAPVGVGNHFPPA